MSEILKFNYYLSIVLDYFSDARLRSQVSQDTSRKDGPILCRQWRNTFVACKLPPEGELNTVRF